MNEIREILAGGTFANAVNALGVNAKRTYQYNPPKDSYREHYQVWEMTEEEYQKLCTKGDKIEHWPDMWGWWRGADGSNLGSIDMDFTVKGLSLTAWQGIHRERFFEDNCQDCSDFLKGDCHASELDIDECFQGHNYKDLLDYIYDEIGATTESNVCAVMTDLAKQNDMTLAELLQKYL